MLKKYQGNYEIAAGRHSVISAEFFEKIQGNKGL